MSRKRQPNTDHAYFRAAERCGWTKSKAKRMMKDASRYGKSCDNLEPGHLQDFISMPKHFKVGMCQRIWTLSKLIQTR